MKKLLFLLIILAGIGQPGQCMDREIQVLPDDCWFVAIDFLELKPTDIKNLCLVSKQFEHVLKNRPFTVQITLAETDLSLRLFQCFRDALETVRAFNKKMSVNVTSSSSIRLAKDTIEGEFARNLIEKDYNFPVLAELKIIVELFSNRQNRSQLSCLEKNKHIATECTTAIKKITEHLKDYARCKQHSGPSTDFHDIFLDIFTVQKTNKLSLRIVRRSIFWDETYTKIIYGKRDDERWSFYQPHSKEEKAKRQIRHKELKKEHHENRFFFFF